MSENKKVLFIINKYSGSGYQPKVEGRILWQCEQLRIEPSIEFTQGRGHATELAQQAAQSKKFDVVFAMGGDGTVNEVARGLVHTGQPMGILPKGSGNGLARHLGIPVDFKKSLALIGSRSFVEMDSFTVNGKLSVNVSGIGFDGHIASQFGKNGKRGFIGYSRLVMTEFFRFPEFEVEIVMDENVFRQRAFIIAFANSSQFGNNARVSPQASVCDEWLDVCFIKKVPIAQTLGFIQKMFMGQLEKSAFVDIVKGKKISISFSRPMPYHVDGEAMPPERDFLIEVQPASIRMVVPQKSITSV